MGGIGVCCIVLLVLSCLVVSDVVWSCLACLIMPRFVVSCLFLPCLAFACIALCYFVLIRLVLPCLVWQVQSGSACLVFSSGLDCFAGLSFCRGMRGWVGGWLDG